MSKLHQYDKKTGVFTVSVDRVIDQVKSERAGSVVYAEQDGIEAAPEPRLGKIAKINADGDGWDYVTDKRGQQFWSSRKSVYTVDKVGEPEGQPYSDQKLVNDGTDESPKWREQTEEEALIHARSEAIHDCHNIYENAVLMASSEAPLSEKMTWERQERCARAFIRNPNKRGLQNKLLKLMAEDEIAQADNDKDRALSIAHSIIANADANETITDDLIGIMRTARRKIRRAKDTDSITAALERQRDKTNKTLNSAISQSTRSAIDSPHSEGFFMGGI